MLRILTIVCDIRPSVCSLICAGGFGWRAVSGKICLTSNLCRLRSVRERKICMAHGRWNDEIFAGTTVSEELALFFRPCRGPLAARSRPPMAGKKARETLVSLFLYNMSAAAMLRYTLRGVLGVVFFCQFDVWFHVCNLLFLLGTLRLFAFVVECRGCLSYGSVRCSCVRCALLWFTAV